LRELQRAIIYTTKMSKQVTQSHVRDAVHMYLVNWGAMLTLYSSADPSLIPRPTHHVVLLEHTATDKCTHDTEYKDLSLGFSK
jgi:hypothetical protein